jgi:ribose transport system permease protein
MSTVLRRAVRLRSVAQQPWLFAAGLTAALMIANAAAQPAFLSPTYLGPTIVLLSPLALAATASTPSILAGGIDVSVGPLLGLVNILAVIVVLPPGLDNPLVAVLLCLAVGTAIGMVNGFLVAVIRLQPVVATIGTYLILAGLDVELLPTPRGPAPDWAITIGNGIGPVSGGIVLMLLPLAAWLVIRRIPYHPALLAVGDDEPAAFASGLDTVRIKLVAYAIGGAFAAIAGVAVTVAFASADAAIGPTYTVVAIAAVALGGTSLAGGRGGLLEAYLGAAAIFLIENLVTALGLSTLWLPLVYGAILIASLVLGSVLSKRAVQRAAPRS